VDKIERFKQMTEEMAKVYEEKNKKYGDNFAKTYTEYGKPVLCIRLEDKLGRLKQMLLKNQEETADETITDTLLDLANYAIMARIELERRDEKRELIKEMMYESETIPKLLKI